MLSFFTSIFTSDLSNQELVRQLFEQIVRQSRQDRFYIDYNVPDNLDGRFELLVIHLFLVLDCLARAQDKESTKLSQKLFDWAFVTFDQELRQMGVGDLGVPKHIKRMAKAFYGRSESYAKALIESDRKSLIQALERNLYGTLEKKTQKNSQFFADYMIKQRKHLGVKQAEFIKEGHINFLPVERG